eukprot:10031839-Heterocapsa_arctica.AAC.1
MGAVLCRAEDDAVLEYWADSIHDNDRARFGAARGDPAFMPEFELLAVLVSLRIWGTQLRDASVSVVVQADATAALGVAL